MTDEKPRRFSLEAVEEIQNEKIFPDTNVWVYLFCPIASVREDIVKQYSRAFSVLLKSTNEFYTDRSILSEFINRYLRIAFNTYKTLNYKPRSFDFKRAYKQTEDFKLTISLITSTIENKILKRAHMVSSDYGADTMLEMLHQMEHREMDLNDLHIERLCLENDLILLTNDKDFQNSPIDILSGNPHLIE